MAYLQILMAAQDQDIERFKRVLHDDVKMTIVDHDDSDASGSFNELYERLEVAFRVDSDWDFEVLHRIDRGNDEIIFINVNREEKVTKKRYAAVWILTCEKGKTEKFLKRFHIELVSKED